MLTKFRVHYYCWLAKARLYYDVDAIDAEEANTKAVAAVRMARGDIIKTKVLRAK